MRCTAELLYRIQEFPALHPYAHIQGLSVPTGVYLSIRVGSIFPGPGLVVGVVEGVKGIGLNLGIRARVSTHMNTGPLAVRTEVGGEIKGQAELYVYEREEERKVR